MTATTPTYYLDLRDAQTRSRIESVKPGKTVQVRVRHEQFPTNDPLIADGTRSLDSKKFYVLVKTSDGEWPHDWEWEELISKVKGFRD